MSAEETAAVEKLARGSQEALAGLSPRGRLVVADTGHDVHVDVPDLVVDAVLDLVVDAVLDLVAGLRSERVGG